MHEQVWGVLTKVDTAKHTVNLTLHDTKWALNAVPLASDVELYFAPSKVATIDDLKKGMRITLEFKKGNQNNIVSVVRVNTEEQD
jgi:hypothetical protein